LIHQDAVFEEATWSLVHQLQIWPAKLSYIMEASEERHKVEKANLEINLLKRKDEFERDVLNFEEDVSRVVPKWTELYNYRLYMPRVHAIKERFDTLEATARELEREESMLLGFKCHTVIGFLDLRVTLTPILVLWTTANDVLSLKRNILDTL
jgi:hypothetical protein